MRDGTQVGMKTVMMSCMAAAAAVLIVACSSEKPKPMAQPTPDQVRGHADKGFDNLKKEESERAAQPPSVR